MKLKYKIVIAITLIGLVLALGVFSGHKKLLKMAIKPINEKIDSLTKVNKVLLLKIKNDSLEAFKMIGDKNNDIQKLSIKIDSLKNLNKENEKALINYGGDFNQRFSIFSDNVSGKN